MRAAQPADAATLSALALRSKAHWGYSQHFMSACRDELTYTADDIAAAQVRFKVAADHSHIAGFYALSHLRARHFELEALFVDPAYIGSGIGRLLLQPAFAALAHDGGGRIIVHSDPNAAAFYKAVGGNETGLAESGSIPGRFLRIFEFVIEARRAREAH